MSIRAYHFVNKTLRDGRPIPPDGEWLKETGKLEICRQGLHASKHVADALKYAPGTTLCLVELDGDIKEQEDKVCASRRLIIARIDATALLRADARASALSVIHLWKAPPIVRQYLETGAATIREEAREAAYAAYVADADADAKAAAQAAFSASDAKAAAQAAVSAADAAAYAGQNADRDKHISAARARLQTAVDAEFAKLGV